VLLHLRYGYPVSLHSSMGAGLSMRTSHASTHTCLQPNTQRYATGELIDTTYYKAFDNVSLIAYDVFKYKLRETFTMDALPTLCKRGFHACKNPLSCLNYVPDCVDLYEVQILGDAVSDGDKIATNKIKIVRHVLDEERHRLLTGSNVHVQNSQIYIKTYLNGNLHSFNDAPAYTCKGKDKSIDCRWYRNGILYRGGDAPARVFNGRLLHWYNENGWYVPSSDIQNKYYNNRTSNVVNMKTVLNGGK
jgi:hypothetical protein